MPVRTPMPRRRTSAHACKGLTNVPFSSESPSERRIPPVSQREKSVPLREARKKSAEEKSARSRETFLKRASEKPASRKPTPSARQFSHRLSEKEAYEKEPPEREQALKTAPKKSEPSPLQPENEHSRNHPSRKEHTFFMLPIIGAEHMFVNGFEEKIEQKFAFLGNLW